MKFFVTVYLIFGGLVYAELAEEVAKKSFATISGYESSVAEARMILTNVKGETTTRKLQMKRFEKSNGDKSFIEFLFPLDIKGTKLLSYERIGTDDRQWLYLPGLKRVKRINSRNKSGSFVSSEFSYEDIATQNYLNYSYSGEAEKVSYSGHEYFQIERIPIDKNSGYSKQIALIDTKTYLIRHGKYYDKKNRLIKEIKFLKYRKIGNIYRVQTIEIKNVQNGKSSTLILDDEKIHAGLSENVFTKRVLK